MRSIGGDDGGGVIMQSLGKQRRDKDKNIVPLTNALQLCTERRGAGEIIFLQMRHYSHSPVIINQLLNQPHHTVMRVTRPAAIALDE